MKKLNIDCLCFEDKYATGLVRIYGINKSDFNEIVWRNLKIKNKQMIILYIINKAVLEN